MKRQRQKTRTSNAAVCVNLKNHMACILISVYFSLNIVNELHHLKIARATWRTWPNIVKYIASTLPYQANMFSQSWKEMHMRFVVNAHELWPKKKAFRNFLELNRPYHEPIYRFYKCQTMILVAIMFRVYVLRLSHWHLQCTWLKGSLTYVCNWLSIGCDALAIYHCYEGILRALSRKDLWLRQSFVVYIVCILCRSCKPWTGKQKEIMASLSNYYYYYYYYYYNYNNNNAAATTDRHPAPKQNKSISKL